MRAVLPHVLGISRLFIRFRPFFFRCGGSGQGRPFCSFYDKSGGIPNPNRWIWAPFPHVFAPGVTISKNCVFSFIYACQEFIIFPFAFA